MSLKNMEDYIELNLEQSYKNPNENEITFEKFTKKNSKKYIEVDGEGQYRQDQIDYDYEKILKRPNRQDQDYMNSEEEEEEENKNYNNMELDGLNEPNIIKQIDYSKISTKKNSEGERRILDNDVNLPTIDIKLETPFFSYGGNIKQIYVNRDKYTNIAKYYKENPPCYEVNHVFFLRNSLIFCKIYENSLLIFKRNIHNDDIKHKSNLNQSFSPHAKNTQSTIPNNTQNTEFELNLIFPINLASELYCQEILPNVPRLIIILTTGQIMTITLADHTKIWQWNTLNLPYIELDIGYSYITALTQFNDNFSKHPDKEDMSLAVCTTYGSLYFFNININLNDLNTNSNDLTSASSSSSTTTTTTSIPSLSYSDNPRRITHHIEYRLNNSIIMNAIMLNFLKTIERDYFINICYVTHNIFIGLTKSGVLKVYNLIRRIVIYEYNIEFNHKESLKVYLGCIKHNPYMANNMAMMNTNTINSNRLNFLIVVGILNSKAHKNIQLYNLSFKYTNKKKHIITNILQINPYEDLGVDTDLYQIGTIESEYTLCSIDLNEHGLIYSSYDEANLNSIVHYFRFSHESNNNMENLTDFIYEKNEVFTIDHNINQLKDYNMNVEDLMETLYSNPELISNECLIDTETSFNEKMSRSYNNNYMSNYEKRIQIIKNLKESFTTNSKDDDDNARKYYINCLINTKQMYLKLQSVFLSKTHDFFPIIFRTKHISLLVNTSNIEGLYYIQQFLSSSSTKSIVEEGFNKFFESNEDDCSNDIIYLFSLFKKSISSIKSSIVSILNGNHKITTVNKLIDDLNEIHLPNFNSDSRILFESLLNNLINKNCDINGFFQKLEESILLMIRPESMTIQDSLAAIDKIEVWSSNTLKLISRIAKDKIKAVLEMTLQIAMMVKLINKTISFEEKGLICLQKHLEEVIEMMICFSILANTRYELKKNEFQYNMEAFEILASFETLDIFSVYLVLRYKYYIGNSNEYQEKYAQEWVDSIIKRLFKKIIFEPNQQNPTQVPDILDFLVEYREYHACLRVLNVLSNKSPAIEYIRAYIHYAQGNEKEMLKALNVVVSFVNMERLENQSSTSSSLSIYEQIWFNWPNKKSAFLRDIYDTVTLDQTTKPVGVFLANIMKNTFNSPPIRALICRFALEFTDLGVYAKTKFLEELLEYYIHQDNPDFESAYNTLIQIPEKKSYDQKFKRFIEELINTNNINKLAELPFDSKTYEYITNILNGYFKEKCELFDTKLQENLSKKNIIDIYKKSMDNYHIILKFYLDREQFKKAGSFSLDYLDFLCEMDIFWRKVYKEDGDKAFYMKVLNMRKNLLNECIAYLDISNSGFGYLRPIIASQAKTKQKENNQHPIKRNFFAYNTGKLYKNASGSSYNSEQDEIENQDGFIILDKEYLLKQLELIKARINLEVINMYSENEEQYQKNENIQIMAKYLILKGEIQQGLSLCLKYRSVLEDTLCYYIKRFFEIEISKDNHENYEYKKFCDYLEKLLKQLTNKEREICLKNITQDILYYSNERFDSYIELPNFIINIFMEENPSQLIDIYKKFGLYDKASFYLTKTLLSNLELLNSKNSGEISEDQFKKSIKYIDPEIMIETLLLIQNADPLTEPVESIQQRDNLAIGFNNLLNKLYMNYDENDRMFME